MKKLVWIAVGAILLLGLVAVGAVLLATGGDPGGWSGGVQAPQPAGPPGALPAPIPVPPAGPTGPSGPMGYGPGPRRVQLNPKQVTAHLSEPLAPCFRSFPMGSQRAAVLALLLEAQAGGKGGFAVLEVSVASWGGASKGLVECASRTLVGQVVPGGGFAPGERARYDLALEPPPSVQPPPPEPAPSTLPASRSERPVRRGGAR